MRRNFLLAKITLVFALTLCFSWAEAQSLSSSKAAQFMSDSVYPSIGYQYPWGISNSFTSNVCSDDAWKGGMDAGDIDSLENIERYIFGAANPIILNTWRFNYLIIQKSNFVIEYLNKSDQKADTVEAEARFIRAYAYFNLVRRFGGVPIVEYCRDFHTSLVRSSKQDVYNFIISELTAIKDKLPQKSALGQNEKYRATNGAASFLLAKVYLYNQDWTHARQILDEIIASSQYNLLANFGDLWLQNNEHNVESIFEIEYTDTIPYFWSGFSNRGNMNVQMIGISSLQNSEFYSDGWGFLPVDSSLVKAYIVENDIVRLKGTILFGDSLEKAGCTYNTNRYELTGYFDAKYTPHMAYQPANTYMFGQNEVLFRYADVLLMNAEAYYHLGDENKAGMLLTQVRARAGLPQVIATGNTLLEAICKERRLEFALEGERYYDIIRWGKAAEVFGQMGFVAGKHEVWPIPQAILNTNPSMTQNPQYDGVEVPSSSYLQVYNPVVPNEFPEHREFADSALIYSYNVCRSDSILTGKAIYTLNNNNDIVQYSGFGYDRANSEWVEIGRETYGYDANRNMTEKTIYNYNYNSDSDPWTVNSKSVYTYADGKKSTFILYVGNDPDPDQLIAYNWVENTEYGSFYFYNSGEKKFYRIQNNDSKREVEYNSDGNMTQEIYYYGDSLTNNWTIRSKYTSSYSDDGDYFGSVYYQWNGDEFVLKEQHKNTNTYNAEDKIVSNINQVRYSPDGTYFNYYSNFWDYSGESVIQTSQSYTFYPYFETSVKRNTTAFIYTDKNLSDVETVNSDLNSGLLVYPNPTTDGVITVQNKFNSDATVKVYSANGAVVETLTVQPGETTINISEKGLYIVSMVCDGNVSNVKLVVK
jgi:starch-binding outer membrane protein, SusD/RagB family